MPDAEPMEVSVMWGLRLLGPFYSILLLLTGVTCFLLVVVLVVRGKGSIAAAPLLLIAHLPLLIGLFAAVHGGILDYLEIATNGDPPRPATMGSAIARPLVALLGGMLMTFPGYLAATVASFVQAIKATSERGA